MAKLRVHFGGKSLRSTIERGWVEERSDNGIRELRLTDAGLAALTATIPRVAS